MFDRVSVVEIAPQTHYSAAHNCTTLFQEDAALWQFGFSFYERYKYTGFAKWPTDLYYRAFYVYSLYLLNKANLLTGTLSSHSRIFSNRTLFNYVLLANAGLLGLKSRPERCVFGTPEHAIFADQFEHWAQSVRDR